MPNNMTTRQDQNPLDPIQITTIQATWDLLSLSDHFGNSIFDNLFSLDPALKDIFTFLNDEKTPKEN